MLPNNVALDAELIQTLAMHVLDLHEKVLTACLSKELTSLLATATLFKLMFKLQSYADMYTGLNLLSKV